MKAVKMFLARGQSAWDKRKFFSSFSHQRLNVEYPFNFKSWLVGFTDGDGTFSIARQNNKWSLNFQIGQNTINAQILYYIKQELQVGSVNLDKKNSMIYYRVRDRKKLKTYIFPIFDTYPLLTTKYFYYMRFKKAYKILENQFLSKNEKDILMFALLKEHPHPTYISPALNSNIDFCKSWVIGFIEAKGSFYIVKKDINRYAHGFAISQKLDKLLLEYLQKLFHISAKVKFNIANNFFLLDTTSSRSIQNIIKYCTGWLKSHKSYNFVIWSKTFNKKENFENLKKVQQLLRDVRKNKIEEDNGIVRTI